MCIYAYLDIENDFLQMFSVTRVTRAEASESRQLSAGHSVEATSFLKRPHPGWHVLFFFSLFFSHLQGSHCTVMTTVESYRASWLLEVAVGNDHSLRGLRGGFSHSSRHWTRN